MASAYVKKLKDAPDQFVRMALQGLLDRDGPISHPEGDPPNAQGV